MSATETANSKQAADQAGERAANLVNIEVNGQPLQAPKGSMIIEATDRAGIEIPRFCYHPKLSIAANCRMCLVDVEKMPKPVPACATPVMDGMKIYTGSRRAVDAQHGVMEFLLINHPLDCPICDQGGECELQDLAMGYGRSVSRFTERKRVVKDKNVGPLVQTEMTRCIHCTRCVRFLEEIAGTSEMGGAGRGDRLEIGTLIENSIDSELSGNIIDLCPVGALTNKPFRFSARAWELVARPSVAVHDGVGSCLHYHVRNGRVMRAVPRENEATNENWLADRDRYSHFGLYAEDRALHPQVKESGVWKTVSWDEAMAVVAGALRGAVDRHGAEQLAFLMSPSAATEEYFLAQLLARGLGCGNIDHRLREVDFADDAARPRSPAFAMPLADIGRSDAILLLGCNPRQEAPIVGHRVRQAWLGGAHVAVINPLDWPFTFETRLDAIVAPQHMPGELAALAAAVERATGTAAPDALRRTLDGAAVNERHEQLAARLKDAERGLLLLGQFAMAHPDAARLRALADYIARATGAALDLLCGGGNATGAWLAGAVPHRGPGGAPTQPGMNAAQMLESPRKAYLLWGIEPEFDVDNPARALRALEQAETVIAVASFATDSLRAVADVILPLAPHAESEGSLVNFDGCFMAFAAAGKASGDARSGWKILRRLGGELAIEGIAQVDLGAVQADLRRALEHGGVTASEVALRDATVSQGLYRIGEVAMYSVDPLCRRATPLQETAQAQSRFVGLNPADAARLGLAEGALARVRQDEDPTAGWAEVEVLVTEKVPAGGVWLRSATCDARLLGHAVAPVVVEPATGGLA
ncbi:MAG: NADH-quinone oxidoreductase subunit NuoG [Xanthomonadales bacterium]|nr:NADH-quinone oxidoreductase subunit NuoG [Xanthomonadales bacterium]